VDIVGRAVTQAVSHPFPTATARVQSQGTSCGICGEQFCTGAAFFRVLLLRFPSQIFIPPNAPRSGAGIIGQLVADVPSGHSLTPPQEIIIVKYLMVNFEG
jgi:hypothetical protein